MQSYWLVQQQCFVRYLDLPGQEPAVVYLHGTGLSSTITYTRLLSEAGFARQRSLLIDLLGFGFSDRPADFGYGLEDHALVVAALLDHLQLRGCTLIGHSLGGSVAVTLAALRPAHAGRLVLLEALLDPGGGETSRAIAAQSEQDFCSRGFKLLLDELRAAARQADSFSALLPGALGIAAPHALHRTAVGLVRGTQPTARRRLLQLAIPRVYIFGERSLPHPDRQGLAQAGVPVLIVPEAGHGMMWDNPAAFAAVLREALQIS